MKKVILYLAIFEDGFIADEEGRVDWLPQPKEEAELERFGYVDLMKRIDILFMGSVSYEQILTFGDWAWPNMQTYVFSSQKSLAPAPNTIVTSKKPEIIIDSLNQNDALGDIWLLGGAKLAQYFAKHDLIDEIILTIIPLRLERGISLGIPLNNFSNVSDKIIQNNISQKVFLKNHIK